jgi:hypothetical protein
MKNLKLKKKGHLSSLCPDAPQIFFCVVLDLSTGVISGNFIREPQASLKAALQLRKVIECMFLSILPRKE